VVTPPQPTVLIRNAEISGHPGLDVRVGPEAVQEIGSGLARTAGERVLDAAGGAVVPGLHDHHVHLRAVVAARQSLDLSAAADAAAFDRLVTAAALAIPRGQWLRATGWDEHRTGPLDRARLDALAGTVPARVQHRSGAMWVLNTPALRAVGAEGCDLAGVERDDAGVPTGRLLRLDQWLRGRLPAAASGSFAAGLAEYAAWAARVGITGFTDATPDRDQADIYEFCRLSESGTVLQRLVLMAPPGLAAPGGRVTLGPLKVMLDDATLPPVAELAPVMANAHRQATAVAVHCVTAEQLVVCTAAFDQAGRSSFLADRIEHASVVPPAHIAEISRLGLAVVTQPGFVAARGDSYRRNVPAPEQDWLYRCASLRQQRVTVAAGSDAPYGPADPWECIAAAISRRTRSGAVLGLAERIPATDALALFLATPGDIHRTRTLATGQPGDVCVLRAPIGDCLARPSSDNVRATIIGGSIVTA